MQRKRKGDQQEDEEEEDEERPRPPPMKKLKKAGKRSVRYLHARAYAKVGGQCGAAYKAVIFLL